MATIKISGKVFEIFGGNQKPVAGAIVLAIDKNMQTTINVFTNANGEYVFASLEEGLWRLSVKKRGYILSESITGTFMSDAEEQNLILHPVVPLSGTLIWQRNGNRAAYGFVKAISAGKKTSLQQRMMMEISLLRASHQVNGLYLLHTKTGALASQK